MLFSATVEAFSHDIVLKAKDFRGNPIFDVPILNSLGYKPVISTFSGTFRSFLGLIHSIVHLVAALFDHESTEYYINQVGIGILNILRGLVEAIPVFGNLAMLTIDTCKIKKSLKNEFITNFPENENMWQYKIIAKSLWKGFDLSGGAIAIKEPIRPHPTGPKICEIS